MLPKINREMIEITLKGHNKFNKSFTRFSKFVFGVYSKASNFAVLSKLGQYPVVLLALVSWSRGQTDIYVLFCEFVAPPRKKNLVTIFSWGHVLGP